MPHSVQQRNSYFNVNKRLPLTRWTTLYLLFSNLVGVIDAVDDPWQQVGQAREAVLADLPNQILLLRQISNEELT